MANEEGFLKDLKRHQLMVAVRTETAEDAWHAAAACAAGGIRFIEITFSVPGADEVIRRLCTDERVAVGAGTVLSVDDAKRAVKAGASYIVSPNLDEEVVRFTKKEGLVSIPGVCTPTEIHRAHKAGADIVKLFPFVELGGLAFLRAIRGPLPFVKYLLCGGATLDNVSHYLAADAAGILIGSAVIRRELLASGDWNAISALSGRFVEKVESSKSTKV